MTKVQRYNLSSSLYSRHKIYEKESSRGDWCKDSDVEKLELRVKELEENGMQQAVDNLCDMAANELNGLVSPDNSTDSINAKRHMSEFANRLRKYRNIIKESNQ